MAGQVFGVRRTHHEGEGGSAAAFTRAFHVDAAAARAYRGLPSLPRGDSGGAHQLLGVFGGMWCHPSSAQAGVCPLRYR